jgi:drug/metabolite transporter (DMT)-like permease
MPFNLLVPFFGISISILLLDEIPSWHVIVGGLITLGGIAVTQVKRLQ